MEIASLIICVSCYLTKATYFASGQPTGFWSFTLCLIVDKLRRAIILSGVVIFPSAGRSPALHSYPEYKRRKPDYLLELLEIA